MVIQNEWMGRGQRAVGAATDLATGLFRGLQNLGPRIQASQYKPIVEAFCAYTGLMAAQHGRLQRTEIDGFRNFLMQNRQHPVFGGFPLDELIEKFKNYAVRAFLEETEVFDTVLHPIARGSEEAHLIVAGCLNVIFADGACNESERRELEQLAARLGVDTGRMAQNMGVVLPQTASSPVLSQGSPMARMVASPPPPPPPPPPPSTFAPPPPPPSTFAPPPPPVSSNRQQCTLCQGKGCVFCNQTGFKV